MPQSELDEWLDEGLEVFDGMACIASLGCGSVACVVTRGEAVGSVWHDLSAADGGLVRAAKSFLRWYRDQLDSVMCDILRNEVLRALSSEGSDPIPHHHWLREYPRLSAERSFWMPDAYVLLPLYRGSKQRARERARELQDAGEHLYGWVLAHLD